MRRRPWRSGILLLLALSIVLAGCGTAPRKPTAKPALAQPGGYYLDDGPGTDVPANLLDIPDAIPVDEPLHRGANRPYTVFGKTYVPNVGNKPFRQTGIASWYGRKFHGQRTSIGERYDMYAMTAAHPTLPLPSYARVTSATNGKSVVVRVNDRGPFHGNRIIDLSYAAAAKLGIAAPGSGPVTVERILPGAASFALARAGTPPVAAAIPASPAEPVQQLASQPTSINTENGGVFIQLGAFSVGENAEGFRRKMQDALDWMREPVGIVFKGGLHRVRIGPLANREEAEAIADKVRATLNLTPLVTH